MSVDKLQTAIRKQKNPSMITLSLHKTHIPQSFLESADTIAESYLLYAKELLTALKGLVPAVRFSFGSFALQGGRGLNTLETLLRFANEQGFYVLLDAPEQYSAQDASLSAAALTEHWQFDGLLVSCYLGSDILRPFTDAMKGRDFDLFLMLRSGNKSASELQDQLVGIRPMYAAAADIAMRQGESLMGKCGYSRIAGVGPATSTDSLRTLRSKYPALFLLIDGFDYPGANAKNCSMAFDNLGHGAIACAGESIVAAWQEENADADPITAAVQAAERMKKNLSRYIAVL